MGMSENKTENDLAVVGRTQEAQK
ncbi:uncharacterized protein G2W53_030969 [Senna tora]|uniref:Uncharacterized protein n=1 Tax=Senna tora TaxID=362788 RepID=A0A834T817_9FABA|nr:uncharacterized protein G2W53_030969 [Senna tora]